MNKLVDEETIKKIYELYDNGINKSKISIILNLPSSSVGNILYRRNTQNKIKKFTLEERILIKKYLDLDLSYKEIGALIGRAVGSVTREVKRFGDKIAYDPEKAHKKCQESQLITIANLNHRGNKKDSTTNTKTKEFLEERIKSLEEQVKSISTKIKGM